MPETIVHALFPLGGEEVERLLEGEASDFMCSVNELAQLRLRQLREGFVSPGWDLTAVGRRAAPHQTVGKPAPPRSV